MNSEKKLFREFGLRISLAVFAAVGLTSNASIAAPFLSSPFLSSPLATSVSSSNTTLQDTAYEQDTVPSQFDIYSLDPKDDRSKIGTRRAARSEFDRKVVDAISGGALNGSQQSDARNWIDRVILAEMTLNNSRVQTQLGEMRQDLFRRYISGASETNRKFIVDNIVVRKAADIANKNYHPAARINAVQILNWLDTKEGISGTQLPEPSVLALQELYKIVNDANSPEYLVATALAGIQRHAELDGQLPNNQRMQASIRNAIVDAMLAQIAKHKNKRSESDPGYLISRRAVQTLSGLNLVESDSKVAAVKSAMQAIADDEEAGRWLRYDAMIALGKMPIANPEQFVKKLGRLVIRTGKEERKAILAAKTALEIEKLVSEKTGTASGKGGSKKGGKSGGRGISFGSAGGGGEASLDGLGGSGGSGGGGGMAGFGSYQEGDLLPFHLHYFRTNVKLATSAAQQILGTKDKASTGLSFTESVRSNPELSRTIKEIDAILRRMQKATDIGLVEEEPMTQSQILRLRQEEQDLIDKPVLVRVLGKVGLRLEDLESLVGTVEVEGEAEDEENMKAMTENAPKATAPADEADTEDTDTEGTGDSEESSELSEAAGENSGTEETGDAG